MKDTNFNGAPKSSRQILYILSWLMWCDSPCRSILLLAFHVLHKGRQSQVAGSPAVAAADVPSFEIRIESLNNAEPAQKRQWLLQRQLRSDSCRSSLVGFGPSCSRFSLLQDNPGTVLAARRSPTWASPRPQYISERETEEKKGSTAAAETTRREDDKKITMQHSVAGRQPKPRPARQRLTEYGPGARPVGARTGSSARVGFCSHAFQWHEEEYSKTHVNHRMRKLGSERKKREKKREILATVLLLLFFFNASLWTWSLPRSPEKP